MSANRFSGGWGGRRRRSRKAKAEYHRARFEVLEPRYALSVSIAPLADVTLLAGAPLNLAVNATDPDFDVLYYEVSSSNPDVKATLLDPYYNQSVRISVSYTGNPNTTSDDFSGDMVFQLFEEWSPVTTARFIDLVDSGGEDGGPFYDGLTFHRVIDGFIVQGGDPNGDGTGGSGAEFNDEFSPELQFTSAGILAMANSGADTNDSQFFITDAAARWLDYRYTIFGFLTSGEEILQKISAVPTDSDDKPNYTVQIDSVSVEINTEDQVLHLAAEAGTTGTSTVTVKAMTINEYGNEQVLASRSFKVTLAADTNNNRPYVDPETPIETTDGDALNAIELAAGSSTTFQINGVDVEGDAIYYGATTQNSTSGVTVTVDSTTGIVTLTASSSAAGVTAIAVGVRKPTVDSNDSNPWDTEVIPVYVNPAAPTVTLAAASDTGLSSTDGVTNLNGSSGKPLTFTVGGTISGAVVEVFADGVLIGQATASGTSTTITTVGAYTLSDGPHSITACQTLYDQEVDFGNYQGTIDLSSEESAPTNIVVDTVTASITSSPVTTATEGQPYSYQVTTDESGIGQFSLVTMPAGMSINPATGLITWTPADVGNSTNPVKVRLSDLAGNVVDQSFSVYVVPVNKAPVATAQTVRMLSDTSKTITLSGDDSDPEVVQTLTFAIVTGPSHGTITNFNSATGTLTYTPEAGYVGADSVTFTVTDDGTAGEPAALTSDSATVSIVVAQKNNDPVADDQSVATSEDTAKSIMLTGNDGDEDAVQTLTFQIVRQPLHGTLSGFNAATGQVTYTPDADYNGSDSFTFTVTDHDENAEPTSLVSAAATVSINVAAVNDRPTAESATVTVVKNTPRSITLTGADGDPEVAQTLVFTIVNPPSHGTLSGFDPATGQVTYTPDNDYGGTDSFTFTVTDDGTAGDPAGLTSDAATITIHVSGVNHEPTAVAQNVATDEDTSLAITLSGDDGDSGIEQTLRYTIVSAPSHGTLSGFDPATGAVVYTPGPDFNGTDSFTFTVTDDDAAGDPANLTSSPAVVSITVSPVDDAPRFHATASKSVYPSQTVRLRVEAYDVDVPAGTIRYSLEPGSPEGMSIDAVTGEILWTVPNAYPAGTITLTVRATEYDAEGTAGLSSLGSAEVVVQDFSILAVGGLFGEAPAGLGRPLSGVAAPGGGSFLFSASGPAAALAGFTLSSTQTPLWLQSQGGAGLSLSDQVNLLNSATLGEHRLGADTGYGGGMVVNPSDADKQGDQEKAGDRAPADSEKRAPNAPEDSKPAPAHKQSQSPAGKQARREAARSVDFALAFLADDADYAEATSGDEATGAAEGAGA